MRRRVFRRPPRGFRIAPLLALALACAPAHHATPAACPPLEPVYPGTCRRRGDAGYGPHALRFAIEDGEAPVEFDDLFQGRCRQDCRREAGDFIVRRRDGPHAYHLAVVVDDAKCIADKGCTVCVDVCPLDVLRISDLTGKAYMKFDECWYCMPCETDCPTGAVTVNIPYLLR